MFSCTFPTSLSSNFPSKIISPILATDAIVVPSLKVLLSMTCPPSLTGTSNTMPVIVAFTNVLLVEPAVLEAPSLIICN